MKTLLNDYLISESDEDLEIFVVNIAPHFKLRKKNRVQLKSMISKYAQEKTKVRLDVIVNFLGVKESGVKVKNAKIKPETQNKIVNKLDKTETQVKLDELQVEYADIAKSIRDAKGDVSMVKILSKSAKEIDNEIAVLIGLRNKEIRAMRTPEVLRQEERALLKSIFGDADDENSNAFKILEGKMGSFKIRTSYDPAVMIQKLFRSYNKEPYEYSAGLIGNGLWSVKRGLHSVWNSGVVGLNER